MSVDRRKIRNGSDSDVVDTIPYELVSKTVEVPCRLIRMKQYYNFQVLQLLGNRAVLRLASFVVSLRNNRKGCLSRRLSLSPT